MGYAKPRNVVQGGKVAQNVSGNAQHVHAYHSLRLDHRLLALLSLVASLIAIEWITLLSTLLVPNPVHNTEKGN